ncbi:hypothetical protein ACFL2T_04195 [Elusimicrobiota bacterium]
MPESEPHVRLDATGVCGPCLAHARDEAVGKDRGALESDFLALVAKHRGKGKYDCLVMCSGGKDSTSSLYYMKRRYRLNPLAFTFDHGFETEDAMENVRNAVKALGTDFLMFRSDYMRDMFSRVLKTGSKAVICHLCSIWYMRLTYDIAARYDIPLIIAGWTKGQSLRQPVMSKCACDISAPEFIEMGKATKRFLQEHVRGDPKYRDFPESMEEVLARAKKRHSATVLSPHWFLPFEREEYVETIRKELGWKYPRLSYPGRSTNCYLNFISAHESMRHFGYTHYHVEMSKLVRDGVMTREEALKDLEMSFDKEFLNSIAKKLDYRFE